MTINQSLSMKLTIDFFNDMKLYEVKEKKLGDEGVIYTIQRLKISEDDTIDKIEKIIKQQREGKIWQKVKGSRKAGTAIYADQFHSEQKIHHIYLIKADQKFDLSLENLSTAVVKMDDKTISLLGDILNVLKARFAANKQAKSVPAMPSSPTTHQTPKLSKKSVRPMEGKELQKKEKTSQELKKEKIQAEEEANVVAGTKKRRAVELDEELNTKSDKILKKARLSHDMQSMIDKEDQ